MEKKLACKSVRDSIVIIVAITAFILALIATALNYWFSQPVWSLVCRVIAVALQTGQVVAYVWRYQKHSKNSDERISVIVLNIFWLVVLLDGCFRTLRYIV